MEIIEIGKILIIGIFVSTTNQGGKSQEDIPRLWQQFETSGLMAHIPNRVSDDVYAIYTNYEGDATKPYDFFIGCAVSSLDDVPEGMRGMTISKGNYHKYEAKGENPQMAVFSVWQKIWNSQMNRAFDTDYEHYKATEKPGVFDISVFVGVNQ